MNNTTNSVAVSSVDTISPAQSSSPIHSSEQFSRRQSFLYYSLRQSRSVGGQFQIPIHIVILDLGKVPSILDSLGHIKGNR
mmetsp:Transcript_45952/g.111305  ORF Transcript_45952/g.111305 Transcript_45952/m.111305 type:complete len:81 (+) Transcript_45952:156-398(+)